MDEEALIQLSVPVELAQKVLRVLEKQCQGSAQRDLRGSRIYAKYFLGSGARQGGKGSPAVSSEGAGCRSTVPEATMAKAAKEDLSAAPVPPQAPVVAVKSDSQLFSELLEREGLLFPEVTEEQIKGSCLLCTGEHARCWRHCHCLDGGRLWAGHGEPCARRLPGEGGACGCWVCGCVAPWELLGGVTAALTPAPCLPPASVRQLRGGEREGLAGRDCSCGGRGAEQQLRGGAALSWAQAHHEDPGGGA